MTERGLPIVDGAPACPFVAFADDRDGRATSPDHRHRCYAEVKPAQRALAHQEAYCLSSSFPVCPTFQDWARREAAKARASSGSAASAPPAWSGSPARDSAPPAGRGSADAGSRAGTGAGAAAAGAAGAAAGAGAGAAAAGGLFPFDDDDIGAPDFLAGRSRPPAREPAPERPPEPAAPPFTSAAGREGRGRDDVDPAAAGPVAGRPNDRDRDDFDDEDEDWEEEPAAPARGQRDASDRGSGAGAGGFVLGGDRRPKVGDTRRRREPEPSRERHRYDAYPTVKTRMGLKSLPRVVVMALALGVAAIALFFLPALLGIGRDNGPTGVGGSPTPTAPPSVNASPTQTPAPTPVIYLVASGDTMSSIATQFGIPLQQLIDANRETIPNPNTLQIGDRVIIPSGPPSQAPASPGGSVAPSP